MTFSDGDIEINQEIGWCNTRRIALQYLQQADDKERTKIWHQLYDDLSYEELEAKYLEASNEVDGLKAEIENLQAEQTILPSEQPVKVGWFRKLINKVR